jgi:transitional endoplasmic reticulum ATPase
MDNNMKDTLTPEECTSRIFELSGVKFEPDIAADLWPKILQHKWLLSEKLGRDVGSP